MFSGWQKSMCCVFFLKFLPGEVQSLHLGKGSSDIHGMLRHAAASANTTEDRSV
jgi:hypothetical protein